MVGVVSEALEEALEGDGLIDTVEFLSPLPASLLPFTCRRKHSSASRLQTSDNSKVKDHRRFSGLPAVTYFATCGQFWISHVLDTMIVSVH